jgi:hypothetical protein
MRSTYGQKNSAFTHLVHEHFNRFNVQHAILKYITTSGMGFRKVDFILFSEFEISLQCYQILPSNL